MPYMDGLGNVTWEGREIDASFQICFGPSFLDIFDCRDVPRCERFVWEGRLLHVHLMFAVQNIRELSMDTVQGLVFLKTN